MFAHGEAVTHARASYRLTSDVIAAAVGPGVLCLDERAEGRTFRLHAARPGAETNQPILRAAVISPDGDVADYASAIDAEQATITRVDIRGALEQRAGFHDMCGGWSDGHDAIAERMIAALELGDVVMVIDSPGGAAAGLQEAVRRVQLEKAEHGRRVIAYADEMIGSAAYWWAAALADEIYAPIGGVVGSIGARAAHWSEAGALAASGIAVTYFVWPGPGKVAFAPELPLSELGKERGERDVAIAGEAFCAAVAQGRGIDRESIVELGADALSGELAIAARLIDGVASLEDVMSYALTMGATETAKGSDMPFPPKEDPKPTKSIVSEDEDTAAPDAAADPKDPETPEAPPADKRECASCKVANTDDARYCKGCGAAIPGMTAEEDDDDGDEDAPPAAPSKPGKAAASVDRASVSLEALVGLPDGASRLAIKTALAPHMALSRYALQLTDSKTPGQAIGGLKALAEDAARGAEDRVKLKAERQQNLSRERMDLLKKLSAADLPGYTRGELFVDDVNASGERVGIKPAPAFAAGTGMKLATLRGLVAAKLKHAGPSSPSASQKTPFSPDAAAAKSASQQPGLEAAKQHPVVLQAAQRSTASPDQLAAVFAAQFPNEPSTHDLGV